MISIICAIVVGDTSNVVEIATLSSVFNFVYGVAQVVNGSLLEKFGIKVVAISSFLAAVCLFVFNYQLIGYERFAAIGLLSLLVSAGTISVTYIAATIFKKPSPMTLGFMRIGLIIISGFCIKGFNKILQLENGFSKVILILQVLFFVTSIIVMFVSRASPVSSKKIEIKNGKNFDQEFWILSVIGVFSSFPYFCFNGGFLGGLYTDSNAIKNFIVNISDGFGFGNLFVIFSKYVNFRVLFCFLCLLQITCLFNVIFNGNYLSMTYFGIGMSYACHILPIFYITQKYKNPILGAAFYNSIVMFFSSFGLLNLASRFLKYYGSTLKNIHFIIKLSIGLAVINLIIGGYFFIKKKEKMLTLNN
jgi:MFS family permease